MFKNKIFTGRKFELEFLFQIDTFLLSPFVGIVTDKEERSVNFVLGFLFTLTQISIKKL